jgi:hypothetical protein
LPDPGEQARPTPSNSAQLALEVNKMNKIIILFLLIIPFKLNAEPLPEPIPKPTLSLQNALSIASQNLKIELQQSKSILKPNDFIVRSVLYTNYFDEKLENNWSWKITFCHIISSDISYTYKITQKKEVLLIQKTE